MKPKKEDLKGIHIFEHLSILFLILAVLGCFGSFILFIFRIYKTSMPLDWLYVLVFAIISFILSMCFINLNRSVTLRKKRKNTPNKKTNSIPPKEFQIVKLVKNEWICPNCGWDHHLMYEPKNKHTMATCSICNHFITLEK